MNGVVSVCSQHADPIDIRLPSNNRYLFYLIFIFGANEDQHWMPCRVRSLSQVTNLGSVCLDMCSYEMCCALCAAVQEPDSTPVQWVWTTELRRKGAGPMNLIIQLI